MTEWRHRAPLDAERIAALAKEAGAAIATEWTDELAGPGYRRAVAETMAARALRDAEPARSPKVADPTKWLTRLRTAAARAFGAVDLIK